MDIQELYDTLVSVRATEERMKEDIYKILMNFKFTYKMLFENGNELELFMVVDKRKIKMIIYVGSVSWSVRYFELFKHWDGSRWERLVINLKISFETFINAVGNVMREKIVDGEKENENLLKIYNTVVA
jgi:hypothetical protein